MGGVEVTKGSVRVVQKCEVVGSVKNVDVV